MNVFALCTGRCGSMTFARAAARATNYTAGHETLAQLLGADRFAYPPNHIEADNRLSWVLGGLDRAWGKSARYVYLRRDFEATAVSMANRRGIGLRGYIDGQLMWVNPPLVRRMSQRPYKEVLEIARDYIRAVEANVEFFLRDKEWIEVRLESFRPDFERFWRWCGAEGDLDAALAELEIRHNAGMFGK